MNDPVYADIQTICKRYCIGRTFFYTLAQKKGCPPLMLLGHKTVVELAPFDAFIRSQLRPTVPEQNKRRGA